MRNRYQVERVTEIDKDLEIFLNEQVPKLSARFGDKFNYNNCPLGELADKGVFLVCKRDGVITGIHISFFFYSFFDVETKILQQVTFFVKPESGRTAFHLFKKFIDIGRTEANHIITMLTSQTNIRPETLKRLGFEELETLYRMES